MKAIQIDRPGGPEALRHRLNGKPLLDLPRR